MAFEVFFLAVGQGERGGDAIAIRYGNLLGARNEQVVIVIDGGSAATGRELVDLIRFRFGTNEVDVVISTHPDEDHVNGLHVVLTEMKVRRLAMHKPWSHCDYLLPFFANPRVTATRVRRDLVGSLTSAVELEKLALRKRIPIVEPFVGQNLLDWLTLLRVPGSISVLSPGLEYYRGLLAEFDETPEPAENPWASIIAGLLGSQPRAAETSVPGLGGLGPGLLGLSATPPVPGLGLGSGLALGLTAETPVPGLGFGLALALTATPPAPRLDFRPTRRAADENFLSTLFRLEQRADSLFGEQLGTPTERRAENDSSAVTLLEVDGLKLLFTGDAGIEPLKHAAAALRARGIDHRNLFLVQVPHHGSRRNVNTEVLDALFGPRWLSSTPRPIAVCSSPATSPKHPSPRVVNALIDRDVAVFATRGRALMWRSVDRPLPYGFEAVPPLGRQVVEEE